MDGWLDDLDRLLLLVGGEAGYPLAVVGRLHMLGHGCQGLFAVAQHGEVGVYVLVDFGGVYLEVDDLGLACVGGNVSGYPVIKAHAYGYEQVALIGQHVGAQVAVHAEHTLVERMIAGQGAEAEHRAAYGYVCFLDKLTQLLTGVAELHSLAYEHQRTFAAINHACSCLDGFVVSMGHGQVGTYEVNLAWHIVYKGGLCILGEVKHYGTRPA